VEFTEKLDRLMKQRKIGRTELSQGTDIPYSTIASMYSKGTENIKLSTLRKIADFFNVSLDYLVIDELEDEQPKSVFGELLNIPIVGRISCGNGVLAYEEVEGYHPAPKDFIGSGDHFYLRAKGDSMTGARIEEGDLLLIRKQNEVENGEIAAVIIGDEAYLKRVYRNGDTLILHSENPAYPPILVPPADAKIVGRLKSSVKKF